MAIDPTNPVVVLCAEGMAAESRRDMERAQACFVKAWESRQDDTEAAIAAHYVARHQTTDADALRWNALALEHAQRAPADAVESFFPSLYLNLAHSHELLGQREEALRLLVLGDAALEKLQPGPYTSVVQDGLTRLRERLHITDGAS